MLHDYIQIFKSKNTALYIKLEVGYPIQSCLFQKILMPKKNNF